MIFKRSKSSPKHQMLSQWHYWYAWCPVTLNNGDIAWFEWITRKGIYERGEWVWSYKEAPDPSE